MKRQSSRVLLQPEDCGGCVSERGAFVDALASANYGRSTIIASTRGKEVMNVAFGILVSLSIVPKALPAVRAESKIDSYVDRRKGTQKSLRGD